MFRLLTKYKPLFEAEGLGGGGGGGGDGWTAPQGLPSEFAGSNADETLGKLLTGYTDLNNRFGGMRDKLSKMPAAPEKPDMYTFEPGDNLKPFFGDIAQDPAFASARNAAHKHGLSQEQFAGFISDVYSPLVEQGVLAAPFNPATELKTFQSATGLDQRATQEALVATETFAKGLINQLKDVPETLKNDVSAMLLGMTDTAAGNVLLRALSGRLSENGIRVEGNGGGEGALTADDLKKLDSDPRIDPRNRDHEDPKKRFDEGLRKRYDEAYNRLYPAR
jgi:hypothetical protein